MYDANGALENNKLSKMYYAFTKSYFKITLNADFSVYLSLCIVYIQHSQEHIKTSVFTQSFSFLCSQLPSPSFNVCPFIHIFFHSAFYLFTVTFVQVFLNSSH